MQSANANKAVEAKKEVCIHPICADPWARIDQKMSDSERFAESNKRKEKISQIVAKSSRHFTSQIFVLTGALFRHTAQIIQPKQVEKKAQELAEAAHVTLVPENKKEFTEKAAYQIAMEIEERWFESYLCNNASAALPTANQQSSSSLYTAGSSSSSSSSSTSLYGNSTKVAISPQYRFEKWEKYTNDEVYKPCADLIEAILALQKPNPLKKCLARAQGAFFSRLMGEAVDRGDELVSSTAFPLIGAFIKEEIAVMLIWAIRGCNYISPSIKDDAVHRKLLELVNGIIDFINEAIKGYSGNQRDEGVVKVTRILIGKIGKDQLLRIGGLVPHIEHVFFTDKKDLQKSIDNSDGSIKNEKYSKIASNQVMEEKEAKKEGLSLFIAILSHTIYQNGSNIAKQVISNPAIYKRNIAKQVMLFHMAQGIQQVVCVYQLSREDQQNLLMDVKEVLEDVKRWFGQTDISTTSVNAAFLPSFYKQNMVKQVMLFHMAQGIQQAVCICQLSREDQENLLMDVKEVLEDLKQSFGQADISTTSVSAAVLPSLSLVSSSSQSTFSTVSAQPSVNQSFKPTIS